MPLTAHITNISIFMPAFFILNLLDTTSLQN
jgi:hypothetical protein